MGFTSLGFDAKRQQNNASLERHQAYGLVR